MTQAFATLILFCKTLIAVQQLCQGLLDLVVSKQDAAKQKVLTDAIAQAQGAKTRDEKSAAAKKLEDAF